MTPTWKGTSAFSIGALLVGFGLGATFCHDRERALQKEPTSEEFENCGYQIIQDVNVLTALRRGKIELLLQETEADLDLWISSLYKEFPKKAFSDRTTLRTLRRAAAYRAEYPYKSDDVEEGRVVAEVLAKVTHEHEGAAH